MEYLFIDSLQLNEGKQAVKSKGIKCENSQQTRFTTDPDHGMDNLRKWWVLVNLNVPWMF